MDSSLGTLGRFTVHHVGVSVESMDVSLPFWERLLGTQARFRGMLTRPYLGASVGIPGVEIEAALIDLPDGGRLELLDYRVEKQRNPPETQAPGNVHVCFGVDDARAWWEHAVSCGARPVNPDGPVAVDAGPNEGAQVAYFRAPDGNSFEVFQPRRT